MKRKDFEQKVLGIWLRSRVPLTLAHVQHLTAGSRGECKQWLDAMVVDGLLDVIVSDDGEMIWSVRGADRPRSGAETVADLERVAGTVAGTIAGTSDRLATEVAAVPNALARRARRELDASSTRRTGERKSIAASAGLSLILGPLGWLYAAPLREAVPGVILFVLGASLIPHALLTPLLGILAPLSGAAGVYYAWRHNQTGERTGLFSDNDKSKTKS